MLQAKKISDIPEETKYNILKSALGDDIFSMPSSYFSISKDLLAAMVASGLCSNPQFISFYEKKLKTHEKELLDRVMKSRYPGVLRSCSNEMEFRCFLAFYGLFLGDAYDDLLDAAIKKINKVYHIDDIEYDGNIPDEDVLFYISPDRYSFPLENQSSLKYELICNSVECFRTIFFCYSQIFEKNKVLIPNHYQVKLSIMIALGLFSASIYGVDLREIQIDGKQDPKIAAKALAKNYMNVRNLRLSDLCGLFCNYYGLEPKELTDIQAHKDILENLIEFIQIIIKDENGTFGVVKHFLYANIIDFFTHTMPNILDLKQKTIDAIMKNESDLESKIEEPAEEQVSLSQYNQLMKEKTEFEKKASSLQEERDNLSHKINDLRSDLAYAKADIQSYQNQLSEIQKANEEEDEADVVAALEPLSEEDLQLLRDLKVVIFGGRDRLHQHMEQDHMGWTYLRAKENFSKNQIDSADLIIIVSKYVSHASYFKMASYSENNPELKKRIIHTAYENKDLIYHQVIDWIAS